LAHVQYVLIQINQPYVQAYPDCIYYGARFHFRRQSAQRNQRDTISDLEWARLKLPLDLGGAGIFDIYNTAKSGFVASYQDCFKHTAIHFPVIKDQIHSNAPDDRRLTCTMKCFNEERTQLICLANELNLPTHFPDAEREAIKLQYSLNQILIKLQYEEFRKSI
jgi:hypothetical protein